MLKSIRSTVFGSSAAKAEIEGEQSDMGGSKGERALVGISVTRSAPLRMERGDVAMLAEVKNVQLQRKMCNAPCCVSTSGKAVCG